MAKRRGIFGRIKDALFGKKKPTVEAPKKRVAPPPTPAPTPPPRPVRVRRPPQDVPSTTDENQRVADHLLRELRGKDGLKPRTVRYNVERMPSRIKRLAEGMDRAEIEFQAGRDGEFLDDDGNNFFWYH